MYLSPAPAGTRHGKTGLGSEVTRVLVLEFALRSRGLDQLLELARELVSKVIELLVGRLGQRAEHRGDPLVAIGEVGVDLVVVLDPLYELRDRELRGVAVVMRQALRDRSGSSSERSRAWPSLIRSLNASSVAWVVASASPSLSNDARSRTRS